MSGFKEHFLDKYFGYRRRYVDHIVREAPQRAQLAVLSELARLTFAIAANALCALILWALAFGPRAFSGAAGWWPLVFGALACVPTLLGAFATLGFAAALRDRRRVQERTRALAKAQRP